MRMVWPCGVHNCTLMSTVGPLSGSIRLSIDIYTYMHACALTYSAAGMTLWGSRLYSCVPNIRAGISASRMSVLIG